MKGTVKWFNNAKGYGFIEPDDGDKDIFVHHSSIEAKGFRSLGGGDKVEFEVEVSEKGPIARHVKKT